MKSANYPFPGARGHGIVDSARCPVCRDLARIHNTAGCVRADCECVLPYGGTNATTAPPGPTPPPPAAAPTPAAATAAAPGPPREPTPPVAEPWLPGAGYKRLKAERPDLPDVTADDPALARADEIIALAKTPRRAEPRPAGTALVDPAAVGEDDADEEVVAVVAGARAATTDPSPLDGLAQLVDRMFSAAYYVSPRWYCPACHLWPLDGGACTTCKAPLQAVYVATIPREITP